MTPNPWIQWSKQAPGVGDYPIETRDEHSTYSIVQVSAPVYPEQYHAMKCAYWRPFVLAQPGPTIEQRLRALEDWKSFMMSQPTVDSVPEPHPDANGWWRIEDKEPEHLQFVKFKNIFGEIEAGRYHAHSMRGQRGIFLNSKGADINSDKWCPLDMSGPVEEK